jgi:lambda family phage tail tape measure protein
MANHQHAATLGVALSLETGNFVTETQKVAYETQKMKNAIAREMRAADKEIQSLKYATEDYGKAVTKVTQLERELATGRLKNLEKSEGGKEKAAQLLAQAAAYDKMAASAKNAANAQFKMNEQQKIQLTYQTTDFVTQIASGQSPLIAALQQGGQLKDVMGGIVPMFKAIGSLFTPTVVGLGSVAVAVGGVGYAFYKAKEDLENFKSAMTLTGGFAGVTYTGLLSIGNVLTEKTNVAIGDARDLMQQLAATGKYTHTSLQAVGEVILRFSKVAGVDAAQAAETLIPLLDGTASSAKQLNDKYHFLTLEQYKQIKALEKQGQLQESIRLQSTLLNQSFQTSRRELGYFEESWKSIGKWASWAWDAMMGWGRDDKGKDLQKLNHEIALATAALNAPTNRMSQAKDENQAKLDALLEQRKLLLKSMLLEDEAAKAKAKAAEKNAKGIRDEEKYGPMGIAKAAELAKAKAEAEFAVAKQSANEIQLLQLDAAKKLADAQLEMNSKNIQEDGKFAEKNLEIYQNKSISIATETAEKIKQIQIKKYMEEQELKLAYQKEIDDDFVLRSKAREVADLGAFSRTDELEFQQKSLDLKYQLIYATETEQKLAKISLEYARKRDELERSESKTDFQRQQLDRQEAIAKMMVTIEESGKRTQQVFDTVWGNMSSAIDNFVKTGKLNMRDFARSTIQSLIAIEMKMQAMSLLRGLFTSFRGGGGFMNDAGGMELAGSLGFADGGDPPVGKVSIVGERGPELFVPRTAGTIIPNHALSGMGGQTINYNGPIIQNMNAIDTQSGLQFLAKNKQGVFAAYQSANRSIPMSR